MRNGDISREDFRRGGADGNRGPDARGDGRGNVDWRNLNRSGRSPLDRTIGDRDYFNRGSNNQRLDYLRLRDTDVIDRIARNPQNWNNAFQDRNFRIRPININQRGNVNFRYRNPIAFQNFGSQIARRLIWWRANQLFGYRWDPRFNMYYDFRGRALGRYNWNIFQPGWRYIVPHYNQFYRGSYFVDNSSYFYYPETYAVQENTPAPPEPVEMTFGGFDFATDLAYRFERTANDVALDLHYNYQGNPDFDNVYREAYDLLANAKDIQAAAEAGDQETVARTLYGLDQLFYHLLDQVADWDRNERKPIGDNDLLAKMGILESVMQHLMYDVGVEPSFEIVDDEAPLPGPNEADGAVRFPAPR